MATMLAFVTKEQLIEWYIDEGLSAQDIGDKFGVTDAAVRPYLKRFNISKPRNQHSIKSSITVEEMIRMQADGVSQNEIARLAGITQTAVCKRIKQYRSIS